MPTPNPEKRGYAQGSPPERLFEALVATRGNA